VPDAPSPPRVAFSVTAHGLGHLTRTCEVANALADLVPELELVVSTGLAPERVDLDLRHPFHHRPAHYEPGTAQASCFQVDGDATREALLHYLEEREARLRAEIAFLDEAGITGVVSDIPSLPVRAAAERGLPAVGLGNFTWDWILEPVLAGHPSERALEVLRRDYAAGSLHLRLPFGPETSPFPASEPAPLVSRPAHLAPGAVFRALGLERDPGRRLALVCPGGWDPDGWEPIRPRDRADFQLLLVGDLPVACEAGDVSLPHALPAPVSFPDLVRAADVVLAKPGYGIASECVTHHTPLVTVDRPGFRETPVLREQLRAMGPTADLGLEDFFAGRWGTALREALDDRRPWTRLPADPPRRVAERLAEALGLVRSA